LTLTPRSLHFRAKFGVRCGFFNRMAAALIRDRLTRERAETIALNGLAFLAAQPEVLERFLRISGIEVDELRLRAADPDTLRALTEFLLGDDALVTGFCEEQGIDPRELHLANHILGQP
jgi:hypothetical protein